MRRSSPSLLCGLALLLLPGLPDGVEAAQGGSVGERGAVIEDVAAEGTGVVLQSRAIVRSIQVEPTRAGGYHVSAVAELSAPSEAVFKVLSNFSGLSRVVASIDNVQVLASTSYPHRERRLPGGTTSFGGDNVGQGHTGTTYRGPTTVAEVRSVISGCILFFCRTLVRVDDVSTWGQEVISLRIRPGQGDFREGFTTVVLTPLPTGGTLLYIEARATPDFVFPSVIGSALVRNTVATIAQNTLDRLEVLALAEAGF